MPFCVQCGNKVADDDAFCALCGARQEAAGKRSAGKDFADRLKKGDLQGLSPRTASILCYAPWLGWIVSIIVLASQRFRGDKMTRFHAFQGLYLFAAYFIADEFLPQIFMFSHPTRIMAKMVALALVGVGVLMMVKTSQGETFHLPVLGELADKSVTEQH